MNTNKSADELLFEKIRNYCLAPWKSTREELPPYGVPVLMAWHHDRGGDAAEIKGFAGYSFGIGARYYYEEIKDGDKSTCIVSHLGEQLDIESFRAIDESYRVGMWHTNYYDYGRYGGYNNRKVSFGLKDPYNKEKSDNTHSRYDYWINFSEGRFGSKFKNAHSADMSFIPESTIDTVIKDAEKNSGLRYQQLLNDPVDSIVNSYPDYWMLIPKLK